MIDYIVGFALVYAIHLGIVMPLRLLVRRQRDKEFVRQALVFARERGGLPCRDCVCAGAAGWCEHREPLPLPKAIVVP